MERTRADLSTMERTAVSLLEEHKKGNLTTDKARRLMFVLCGINKTAACKLDRLKGDCPIIKHSSLKDCEGCGHFC